MIIDTNKMLLDWIREYVNIPHDFDFTDQFSATGFLLAFLLREKVFTIKEMREELRQRHIIVHEDLFKRAMELAQIVEEPHE